MGNKADVCPVHIKTFLKCSHFLLVLHIWILFDKAIYDNIKKLFARTWGEQGEVQDFFSNWLVFDGLKLRIIYPEEDLSIKVLLIQLLYFFNLSNTFCTLEHIGYSPLDIQTAAFFKTLKPMAPANMFQDGIALTYTSSYIAVAVVFAFLPWKAMASHVQTKPYFNARSLGYNAE